MLEDMADVELEDQLRQAGTKLLNPPSSVDDLLSLLEEVESSLSKVEQSPSKSMQNALVSSVNALAARDLLRHADINVRVFVASCVSEITRITAPDAPYSDDQMKQIFQLIVGTFERLWDTSCRSFSKRVSILETVAKVRSCVVMLDLECDGLILEMFGHFLKSIRNDHPDRVYTSMETIMTLVLEESEDISPELLYPLLNCVKKDNQNVLPVARKLADKVLENCRAKLKPYLMQAVRSLEASPNDYSKTVASICQLTSDTSDHNKIVASMCQETSDTTEHNDDSVSGEHLADERGLPQKSISDKPQPEVAEEPQQEAAHPGEDNLVSEKSAKFATSNGDAQNVNDDAVDVNSPNQERVSQPAHQGAQIESNYVVPKIVEEETTDQPAKRKRGRKSNFPIDTPEASGRSDMEVDKEPTGILSQGKSHNKEDDKSISEDQAVDKLVLPSRLEKEAATKVTSPSASQDEHVKVGPSSPHQTFPEEGQTKRGRGRPRKGSVREDIVQSPSLPKEVSSGAKVESDTLVSVDPVSKRGPEGENENEERPKRRSAKKGQFGKANDKTSGAASDSEEKPLKKSGKKVDKRESKGRPDKENEKISGKEQLDKENEKTSGANSDSEGKPLRKSANKKADTKGRKMQSDKEIEKTSGATSDVEGRSMKKSGKKGDERENKGQSDKGIEKDSGATSESEGKSSKKSVKKGDTKGSNRDESAAKKQGDKSKEEKNKKELPGESSSKRTTSARKSTEKSASKPEMPLEETPRTTSKRKHAPAKEETSEKHSGKEFGEEIVGNKIKVWWPKDKMYYEGIVESYDPSNKKHKVSYTDGDVEILHIHRQKYQFIDEFTSTDVGEATDLPTEDATPEMPQRKKPKTNSDTASKQAKTDASVKKGKETSTSKSKDGGSKSGRKSKIVDEEPHEEAAEETLILENDNNGKSKSSMPKTGSKSKDTPKTGTKSKADTPKVSAKSKDATPKADTPKTVSKPKDAAAGKAETKSEDEAAKTRTKAKNVTAKSSSKSGANGTSAKGKSGSSKLQESEGGGSGKGKSLGSAQESETTSGQKRKRVKG